ncbi:unnamed protein product, partial [Pylaiella littoralis]
INPEILSLKQQLVAQGARNEHQYQAITQSVTVLARGLDRMRRGMAPNINQQPVMSPSLPQPAQPQVLAQPQMQPQVKQHQQPPPPPPFQQQQYQQQQQFPQQHIPGQQPF